MYWANGTGGRTPERFGMTFRVRPFARKLKSGQLRKLQLAETRMELNRAISHQREVDTPEIELS